MSESPFFQSPEAAAPPAGAGTDAAFGQTEAGFSPGYQPEGESPRPAEPATGPGREDGEGGSSGGTLLDSEAPARSEGPDYSAFDSPALHAVPSSPSGYGDFGYGQGIDKSSDEYRHYTQAFHEAGISPRQAKQLLDKHLEWSRGQAEHMRRRQDHAVQEYRGKVREEFTKSLGGEDRFHSFAETAKRGFLASAEGAGLSRAESKGLLDIMGDDPRFIKIFNSIGKLHREDVLVSGARAGVREESFDDMFSKMFNPRNG